MQKLDVQQCTKCKKVRIKIGEPNKWSGVCAAGIEHLRQTYEVNLIDFLCNNCQMDETQHHIACTAGAVH